MTFLVGGINDYEIPFRPPFELKAAAWWGGAAAITVPLSMLTNAPYGIAALTVTGCAVMAALRFSQGYSKYSDRKNLNNYERSFTDLQGVADHMDRDSIWMGTGFVWDKDAANRAYEVLRRGSDHYKTKKQKKNDPKQGAVWLQNLKKHEELRVEIKGLEGHTLIAGTTGAGKTRLLDVIVSQLIMRQDGPVIVIDPKGDKELEENMRRACKGIGHPERFVVFDPAHAKTSCRIDPCRNWSRSTEIPSRITDMMNGGASDPFKDIAWNALNTGVQGMIYIGENPSLKKIRNFIEVGAGPLLKQVLLQHFAEWSPDWEAQFANVGSSEKSGGKSTGAPSQEEVLLRLIDFYHTRVEADKPDATVDALITLHTHNREHFQKLIASLIPILAMLTSDVLGDLLSPNYGDPDDQREILDFGRAIREGRAVYLALDSLSDGTVASAVGSMMLADLAAVAGKIYNYEGKTRPIYLVIDEASEVINDPAVRILNKGRGAGFQTYIATQTVSDFEARMGTKPSALQALGNVNNIITLRVIDPGTQEYITDQFPKFYVESMKTSHKESTGQFGAIETDRAGYSESLEQEYLPLVEPSVLGSIPDLEYMAKLKDGRVLKGRIPIVTAQAV